MFIKLQYKRILKYFIKLCIVYKESDPDFENYLGGIHLL